MYCAAPTSQERRLVLEGASRHGSVDPYARRHWVRAWPGSLSCRGVGCPLRSAGRVPESTSAFSRAAWNRRQLHPPPRRPRTTRRHLRRTKGIARSSMRRTTRSSCTTSRRERFSTPIGARASTAASRSSSCNRTRSRSLPTARRRSRRSARSPSCSAPARGEPVRFEWMTHFPGTEEELWTEVSLQRVHDQRERSPAGHRPRHPRAQGGRARAAHERGELSPHLPPLVGRDLAARHRDR